MTERYKTELKARFVAALDGHTKYSRDCTLTGEYLTEQVWPIVEQIISAKFDTEAEANIAAAG